MKKEAEQQRENGSLTAQLRIGFLLTSPGADESSIQAGEQILREVLATHTDLMPRVKDLVELRLAEVEARQSIRTDLRDAEGKIEALMSIERSMEERENQDQSPPR